jgi:hypothetical protein
MYERLNVLTKRVRRRQMQRELDVLQSTAGPSMGSSLASLNSTVCYLTEQMVQMQGAQRASTAALATHTTLLMSITALNSFSLAGTVASLLVADGAQDKYLN